MNQASASFRSIEIRRMPGFQRGELALPDLCAGINVIYGPNASGKTTLCRAIHRLLRPTDPGGGDVSLRASFELDGAGLELDYDLGRMRATRRADGASIDYPRLAPPEIGDRHVLALQDLIRTEHDRDLARQIVKELSGGYDVGAARRQLDFRRQPTRRGKLTAALQQAERRHQAALRRQDELLERQTQLNRLRREKAQAEEAQAELALLEKAAQLHAAAESVAEIRNRLRIFPAGVARVTAHDVRRLDQVNKAIEAAAVRRRKEETRREKAAADLAQAGFAGQGLPDGLITALNLKCRRLMSLSGEIQHRLEAVGQAEADLDQARANLGPAVDAERAARLEPATVQEYFAFARRMERHRADRQAAESLRAWLEAPAGQPAGDPDLLHEAVILLNRWLGVSQVGTGSDSRYSLHFTIAGVALIVLGLAMTIVAHPSWLLLLVAAAAMIAWAFRPHSPEVLDRRAEIEHDYESFPLPPPDEWAPAAVRARARDLQKSFDEATLQREKANRWAGLADRLEQLLDADDAFEEERSRWIERIGLDADADEASLVLTAGNIQRYQDAQRRRDEALRAVDAARRQSDQLLAEINEALAPYGLREAGDPDQAHALVEQLDARGVKYAAAAAAAIDAAANLDLIGREIEDLKAEQSELFRRAGLARDEEPLLREWARQRDAYDAVAVELRMAEHNKELLESALATRPDLVALGPEQLAARREQSSAAAARLERINQDIGAIEEAIDSARRSTDIEARLAEVEEAADALRAQRGLDHDALVGSVLADYVMEHQQQDLPGILRRARDLFARITHGRYELHVHQGDPPEFRAFDTTRREGLALDELSSGTRLQLLLAVRVAFVEMQEQRVKVPLVLDETLGNSDERRAREIIDALIEICRDGRQVFYFTAQHDEVGKWRHLLERCDQVPNKLIDLAEVRRLSEAERAPRFDIHGPEPAPVPPPAGLDWQEYGRLLKAPPIDPLDETGNLHVWYLIEDVDLLYRLLEAGVDRWGQLQTLANYGRLEAVRRGSPVYRQAEAAVRAVETAAKAWRVGRGEPVDRAALAASGAVSDTFLDRLDELARNLRGDARRLIEALDRGEVRGFRSDKRDALADYLAGAGYLPDDEPLSPEEVRDRTRSQVFDEIDRGAIRRARVDRLVDCVLAGGQIIHAR